MVLSYLLLSDHLRQFLYILHFEHTLMFIYVSRPVIFSVIARGLESTVTLCDASQIKPRAAHSLLPCQR